MTNAAEIVGALRELRPAIEERADEIERLGTIPADLYADLVATGYLAMAVPARFGGAECTLPEMNAIIAEAARADGSVGWLAMIACHVPIVLSRLPPATFASLFDDGPDLRARVALAPKGVAVPAAGGYLVSGQFPFASGGPDPEFVGGGCIVMENGAPSISDIGIPRMLMPVIRAEDVEFLDTWHVMGLKGTDSCDFVAREVFVPEECTADLFFGESCLDGPLRSLSFRAAVSPGHVAVGVGIARGAVDELASLALTKRSAFNPVTPLGADREFQHAFGELALHIEVAEAFLQRETQAVWDAAASGTSRDAGARLRAGCVAPYGTALCVRAIDAAYTLAGSASLYESSPLQRRLRDIHVATQHFGVSTAAYASLGAALAGQELGPMEMAF